MKFDFSEFSTADIEARRKAISAEIDAPGADLDALEEEVRALNERETEIKAAEARRAKINEMIEAGQTLPNPFKEETPMEARKYTAADAEYRSAFFKNLLGQEMTADEKRAYTYVTTNSDSANVMPTETQNRIWSLIDELHPIVADVNVLRTGVTIEVPVAKSIEADATADNTEGAEAGDLKIKFEGAVLGGKDFTADVEISYRMARMAIPAFEDYLVKIVSERIGAKMASYIINLIKTNCTSKVTDGITYDSICDAFGSLKRVNDAAIKCYTNRTTHFGTLLKIKDDEKRPILQPALTAGAAATVLAAPIAYEDALTGNEVLIGDPNQFVLNMIQDIMVESQADIKNHKIIHSGYACAEGALVNPDGFASLSAAS